MAYYENSTMLHRQDALLRSMPAHVKQNVHVIVVDDCSEKVSAHKAKIEMPRTVFRILPPKVEWNQDAARNIGAHEAKTKWLLLTDMDHMVPVATWESLICKEYRENAVYKFSRVSAPDNTPYKPHPNSWFMTREMYWKAGGYDERFAGYYGTDADFRDRVRIHAPIIQLSEVLVRVGREVVPDASTTQFLRKTEESAKNLRRIAAERAATPGWAPKTLSFPYERVM